MLFESAEPPAPDRPEPDRRGANRRKEMPADEWALEAAVRRRDLIARVGLGAAALAIAPAEARAVGRSDSEIVGLHRLWAKARIEANIDFLQSFYGAELRIQAMNGSVITRAQDIAAFASRQIRPELIEHQDLQVALYGATALVTGVEHVRGTAFGRPGEFRLRFVNVLVRRAGRWRLVLHQTTQIPASSPVQAAER